MLNSIANFPKLRFPYFTKEWELRPLSDFLHEHKTKSDGKCEVHSVSVSKGVINQKEYLGRSFAAADTSKYNLVKLNDVIYTKSPTGAFLYGIVKQNKNPYNVIVSPLYAVYTPINKYIGYILDSYFENPINLNNYLSSLVQKGAKNTIQITNDTFISKAIWSPIDETEQQKIAECLSALDDIIRAEGQKTEALREYKRGLMQQLFPANGASTPQLRFPGFTREWDTPIIADVFEVRNGYTPSKFEHTYWDGGTIPWFRMEDIRENGGVLSDSIQHITSLGVKGKGLFKKNSIILATTATVGVHAIIIADSLANQQFTNFSIRESLKSLYSARYVYYAFFGIDEWCKKNTNAGGLLSVNMPALLKQPFYTPSLAEQQKIADCLSSLDEMITAQASKTETLREYKRGLMQQLFPQPSK